MNRIEKIQALTILITILWKVIFNYASEFIDFCQCRNHTTGLERLIDQIFTTDSYNQLVRPADQETGLTVVSTELKLLQIDLVFIINYLLIENFQL